MCNIAKSIRMLCTNCQKQTGSDALFCNFCGFEVKPSKLQKVLSVGRGHGNDIVLDFPQISYEHALLIKDENGWTLEDRNSANHTYVNDRSVPVFRKKISLDDTIFFGSYKIAASRLLGLKKDTTFLGRFAPLSISIKEGETIFGRDPKATVHLNYPQISWHHAKLVYTKNGFYLEDLGSTNGTFVNGKRVKSSYVTPKDVISFGSFAFRVTEDFKIVQRDYRGDIRIDAEEITVTVPP